MKRSRIDMSHGTDLGETIDAMRKRTVSLAWLAALTGLLALTACDSATNSGMGTVRLHVASSGASTMMTAASQVGFDDITSAVVYIDSAVLMPGHVAIDLASSPMSFQLIGPDADLVSGVTALLGAAPALGEYEQLRLFVRNVTVTAQIGEVVFDEEARVPSGAQTGIKVNFGGPIEVGPDSRVDLVAVFNVNESFVFQGPPTDPRSVSFKPVIHASTMPVPSIGGTVSLDIATAPTTPTSVTITASLNEIDVATTSVEIKENEKSTSYILHYLPAPTLDSPAPADYLVKASATVGGAAYSTTAPVTVTAPVRVTQDLLLKQP